ncbi:MAG TPA: S9 family peptidase [Bacteroidota bacterium]|nr:S9 family peptidase [Bacteroidota bacterium]
MNRTRSILLTALSLLFTVHCSLSQARHAITFDDLFSWGRVADPQISPDGKWIAYTVTYYSKVTNGSNSDIWLIPTSGGEARQITNSPKADDSPRWLPDGKTIAFISSRDGDPQVYTVPVTGGEPKKISSIAAGVSGLVVSHDGKYFAVASDVFPDCATDSCNKARLDEMESSKVKAKIFTRLPYRVWNHYLDGKRSHVFILPSSGGQAVDATPGDYDSPPIDIGGNVDYAFSPDSKEFAFVRNTDPMVAISTNNDVFTVPLQNGKPAGEPQRLTENKANDNQPLYSPDGMYIAYRAMKRAGFEADKYDIILYDRTTAKRVNLTENFDRSPDEVAWSPDGKALYFDADDEGYHPIYKVSLPLGKAGAKVERVSSKIVAGGLGVTPDGKTLFFTRTTVRNPHEVWTMDVDGRHLEQLTATNDSSVATIEMNPLEEFWFDGAGGTKVEGFLLKPPFFDSTKKYPMVYLIHGGPQGQWDDLTHYRWNPEMFASPGFVVVMVNPRGSTGYGQKFTDEISGDWGGKVFTDLMNGVKYAMKTYSFIDTSRVGAAGASYGGYMIDWIEGHNDEGIFKVLVGHDGDYNTISAYGSTEELWFEEWEFKGTPWTNRELYEKFSPSNFVTHFKTPMLVIHSQLDYRLDVSEGFQMFTALQRMHVPSEMLYFPDEGHFVLKPLNSELWHKTVLGWLVKYLK